MARSSASSFERLGRIPAPPAAGPRVYLDYGGFSPVDPRVVAMMRPFLEGGVGNPNAQHSLGLEARASLDGARAKVARLFAAAPAGVVFTASATEANNLAIKGLAQRAAGRHVVTSSIEHISVIDSCRDLEKRGWTVTYLGVDAEGRVDPQEVARALREDTVLVSVMAANGEIGTLQPVREIGRVTRGRGVPFQPARSTFSRCRPTICTGRRAPAHSGCDRPSSSRRSPSVAGRSRATAREPRTFRQSPAWASRPILRASRSRAR